MVEKQKLFEFSRTILSDIETILHYNSEGSFYLPEDTGGEMSYQFLGQDLTLEFDWEEVDYLNTSVVLGDFYNGEDTIKIVLKSVESVDRRMVSKIGEVLTHELVHWIQEMDGFDFPNSDDVQGFDYYLQPHEIEAQYYGFLFQSEFLGEPIEKVVEEWVDNYSEFHEFEESQNLTKSLLSEFSRISI